MRSSTLISIITPMYNSGPFIAETIESVIRQSYQDWELIIIDDCSSDNSINEVKRYMRSDPRIKLLVNERNSGTALTRNFGLLSANGEYVAFLDSDDIWMPDKLEKQLCFMEENSAPLLCTAYNRVNEENKEILNSIVPPKVITFEMMLKTNHIACSTAMINRRVLGDIRFRNMKWEDYIFWLDAIKKCGTANGMEFVSTLYRVRKNAYSANKFKNLTYQWRVYRNHLQYSYLRSIYYTIHYMLNGVYKHYIQ